MPSALVNSILSSMNAEVLNQLDLAVAIKHPGESGRAREQIVAAYLRRVIPQDFGISTGFVFDAAGSISRQIDIVIYRTGYHPIFEIGGIKHFIVESVVAVIENKATIGSTEKLLESLENIRSVKALDRTNAGTNYAVLADQQGPTLNPSHFAHQIFGAIVTENSMQDDTLKDGFFRFFRSHANRAHWPNIYADLRGTTAMYLEGENQPTAATNIPAEGNFFALTDRHDSLRVPSLLVLTFELVNFLRIAPVVDFKPTAYLDGTLSKNRWWKLDLNDAPP